MLYHGHPAIDVDGFAGDIGGFLGGQISHGSRDFLRQAHAPGAGSASGRLVDAQGGSERLARVGERLAHLTPVDQAEGSAPETLALARYCRCRQS